MTTQSNTGIVAAPLPLPSDEGQCDICSHPFIIGNQGRRRWFHRIFYHRQTKKSNGSYCKSTNCGLPPTWLHSTWCRTVASHTPCQTETVYTDLTLHQLRRSLHSDMERLSILGRRVDRRFVRVFSRTPLENLTHLTLTRNQLFRDVRSVKLLMKHLPTQSLRHLDLSWNGLDAEAAAYLGRKSLEHLSLLSLRLSGNPIGPKGLRVLVEEGNLKRIPYIDLWDCDIADEGAKILGAAMAQGDAEFRQLVLDMNGIGNIGIQALSSGLVHCPSLIKLELYCNNIDDQGIEMLVPALTLSNVECLNLRANQVGPAGAKVLASILQETSLRKLFLCHNGIGDEGAGHLASALTIRNVGVDTIVNQKTTSLEELYLGFNQLTVQSVRSFASMLVTNTVMKRLSFSGNLVDRRDVLPMVSVLQTTNTTLLELNILEPTYENHLVNDKIALYTGANVSGRRYWGDLSIPLSVWTRKIQRMNPDLLYWFLKQRPDVASQPIYVEENTSN